MATTAAADDDLSVGDDPPAVVSSDGTTIMVQQADDDSAIGSPASSEHVFVRTGKRTQTINIVDAKGALIPGGNEARYER